jgi:tetratricopeptide (TPR) repeat protein
MEKNGDYHRAQRLNLYRAWIHLNAMDFTGVLAICNGASCLPQDVSRTAGAASPEPFPTEMRMCLVLSGSAELALGEHQQALEHLSAARDAMDRDLAICDWYWQLLLDSSLTELWFTQGDLTRARHHADRFLQRTLATEERAWQSLAWQTNARVAAAEGNHTHAHECIAKALATMDGFDLPLAEWRVHSTAAALGELSGNREVARRHRDSSRASIVRIADSLRLENPLRMIFLAAPPVAEILATGN